MNTTNIKRKLVAILAADAVGFSRQMGENEERTMRVLSAHRAVIDGIIAFHEGRIVGTAGDSVLAEFASPTEALRCAVEIQEAIKTRNDSLPERDRMQFRIGVNLGDVMVKGDDLLGDGVNVASRLESIAEPGGICISSSVYDQISGKLDLGFVEIGEQKLKNIPRPIRVYRVSGSAARPSSAGAIAKRRVMWPYAAGALLVLAAIGTAWRLDIFSRPAPAPTAATPAVPAPVAPASVPPRTVVEAPRGEDPAKAELAAAEARAAAEVAKVRAEAEIARARAETAALRRQAAADLAAARASAAKPEPVAAKPEPVATKPESTVKPAPVAPAPALAAAVPTTPPAAPAARTAAAWIARRTCEPIMDLPALSDEVPVMQSGGEYMIEKGNAGQPGYFAVRGTPQPGGRLVLSGQLVSGIGPAKGREMPVHYEGSLDGERYELKGRMGRRPCSLAFTRLPP